MLEQEVTPIGYGIEGSEIRIFELSCSPSPDQHFHQSL